MNKSVLRGVTIGAGRVSEFHLQAWRRIPEAKITAIIDLDLDAARQRAEQFGLERVYPTLDDFLADHIEVDFIDIASPTSTHPSLTETATRVGLHVLCQKPFAYSLKEAGRMIDVCRQADVLLMINENWRWRTWYREIKTMIERDDFGRLLYAKFFVHSDHWVNLKRRTMLKQRGHGTLLEWGIHHLDVMRFLFGEVESVYARLQNTFEELADHEQRSLVILNFVSGMIAYLDISSASFSVWGNVNRDGPMVEDVRIEGDGGTVLLLPDPDKGDILQKTTLNGVKEQPAYIGPPQEAYQASYTAAQRHFIECLISDQIPETVAEDNYETLAVTLAAYESARRNQVIRIEDYKRQYE